MDNILSKYRDRLVNIRRNNKTLNLGKLTKKFFDLSELCEYNFNEGALVDYTISCKEYDLFKIGIFKQSTEENLKRRDNEEKIYKKLRKIDQEADLIKRTSGMHVEYIGYPFIEGKIGDATIKAPLLLFPVDLTTNRKTQIIKLTPQTDMGIQFNKSLVFAIEKYLGQSIDENDQIEIINIIVNKKIDLNQRIAKILEVLSKYILISDELPKATIEKFSDNLNDEKIFRLVDENDQIGIINTKLIKKTDLNQKTAKIMKILSNLNNEKIFRIRNYMILGIFVQFSNAIAKDYEKLMKLDDLGLISYLLNGNSDYEFDGIDIDDISENEKYFISDIDPSQEASIMSIVNSNNKGIVIHGPPGTGKSQTIVNLISQFVKDKKKVLMVCQKKTALDVVKNRLDAVGIKNAVLIEDYARDRNHTLKEMEKIINECDIPNYYNDYELQKINNQIDEKIKELNELKEILGKKYECGLSLFELYSKNKDKNNIVKESKLRNIFLKYKYDEVMDSLSKLEKLLPYAKYGNGIMQLRKNWKDLAYTDKEKIEELLEQLIKLNKTIEHFEIPNYTKKEYNHKLLDEVYNYMQDIQRLIELLNGGKLECQILENKISSFESQLKILDKLIIPDNSQINYNELKQNETYLITYGKYSKQLFVSKFISKLFNSEFRSSEKIVKELENKSNIGFKELYKIYKSLESLDDNFNIPEKLTRTTIENWKEEKLNELLIWKIYYRLKPKFELQELLNNETEILRTLNKLKSFGELHTQYQQNLKVLSGYFNNVETLRNNQMMEILEYVTDEFDDIRYYDTLKDDLKNNAELILFDYLSKYDKDNILNTYYYIWIDNIEKNSKVFRTVKKIDNYEDIKKELNELYSQKFQETKKHLNAVLKNIAPCKEAKNKIPYEANKKRRRKPLKEIIELYENDVLDIIPIWLTTPDVVSAIFPLKKGLFDIVIYDEASQMPMEYALPSLYRAKRFVIAGDEKQLPPTDFFKASFDDDDDEIEGIDELEAKSLLELCKTRCPTALLSYHYRAKYEEIINFSNYAYYNGKIAISPNKHRGRPFEFIKVNGRWENRKNYVEAKKVVEKVYELLNENSEKSIGIITFNSEHRDLIIDELERKASEDDEFRILYEKSLNLKKDNEDMSLFVRNIENVQGDERDIIIFSTAYAKDKDGRLRYNFGPLSRVGGENRLNVAITRAKEKVIIITSIEPDELKVENLKNEGPKLLKKYMQYVKFISNGDYANAEIILNSLCNIEKLNELQFDSPFEEEVYDELTKRGHTAYTQVGCSKYRIDLAIKHPKEDKYILGIECDGATYHSSRSAKERDMYRQKFLEMKGWKIVRIWSRNWWKNREKEIRRIENEIKYT
ncbi:MAG: hypothetical protein PWP52_1028 [Bacteroidales bacterium]|uniref:AAA domain-containing protein n=1 Tax=Methanothermococcus thermolithotrophicus TaxID=2186 RepID=UPI00036BED78|nr:AAA domain-containing protein [Methanothermococcus thermolithotrophicus]MDK2978314.1 hypothetical protein [Bacteroidales bacterium]